MSIAFLVFVFVALVGRVHAQTQTSLSTAFYSGLSSDSSGSYLTAVVLGGLIYYSNDSGVSWKQSDAKWGDYYAVAASSNGQHVIVAEFDATLVSSDYGQHFVNAANMTGTISVAVSGSGQNMISMSSSSSAKTCLSYSINYGASFTSGLGPNSSSPAITVAIDTSGTYVVLSVHTQGLWTTNNIIDPFAWKLTYETDSYIGTIAFGGATFYAGYLSNPGYVVESSDYGYNWTVKGSVSDAITSMAVDSTGVNVLITTYFGLYLSQDAGTSFDWIYSAELHECAMNGNTTLAVFAGAPAGSVRDLYHVFVGNPLEMAASAPDDSDDDAISPGIIVAIVLGSFAFCCVIACIFIRLYFGRLLICWPANEPLKESFLSKA